MSNSIRAKERRSRRSKMTKHQRTNMAQQHWEEKIAPLRREQRLQQGIKREQQEIKLASLLGLK